MTKPDGGLRAWIVVVASFMISFIQDGILFSFGIFLPVLSTYFETGRANATTVNSIMTFVTQVNSKQFAYLNKKSSRDLDLWLHLWPAKWEIEEPL